MTSVVLSLRRLLEARSTARRTFLSYQSCIFTSPQRHEKFSLVEDPKLRLLMPRLV